MIEYIICTMFAIYQIYRCSILSSLNIHNSISIHNNIIYQLFQHVEL
nr:MAG TPA: hypothetical protein [Caudoviricetes sp.]